MLILVLGILAVIGIAFVYSNLGMGGGILYVPVLFWILASGGYPYPAEDLHHIVVPISLMMIIGNAAASLNNHQKKKLVDWKLGGIIALGALVGAVVGTWFNLQSSQETFYLLFLFVIILAISKMMVDGLRKSDELDSDDDSKMTKGRVGLAALIAVGSGFMVGTLGLGGGVINVPVLIYILGRGTKKAVGTSFVVILFASFIGIGSYAMSGSPIEWPLALILAPVVFCAAFVGSRWGLEKLKGRSVRLMFIMVLLIAIVKVTYDLISL